MSTTSIADQGKPAQPTVSAAPAAPAVSYAKGMFFCLTATLSFGIMFPVMTSALTRIDPFTFTSLRYLVAGTAFLLLLLSREGWQALRMDRLQLFFAWLLGSVGFAGFGFFVFLGQQLAGREGALTASIMMATQPMLGLLLNSAVRRVMPPLYCFLFILASFFGVMLVVTKGDLVGLVDEPQHYAANALIVLGAFCWVIYTFSAVFFPKWSAYKYTTVTTWLGLTSIIGINLILFALGTVAVPSPATLAWIIPHLGYMGLIAGFIGILSWNLGNRLLAPLNGVLFMDVVPVTTFLVSTLEGIVPASIQVVGAVLTGSALVCNNLYLRHRARTGAGK